MSSSEESDSEYEHLTEEVMDKKVNIHESESENSENDPDYIPTLSISDKELESEASVEAEELIHNYENTDISHTVIYHNQALWRKLMKANLKINDYVNEISDLKNQVNKYKQSIHDTRNQLSFTTVTRNASIVFLTVSVYYNLQTNYGFINK